MWCPEPPDELMLLLLLLILLLLSKPLGTCIKVVQHNLKSAPRFAAQQRHRRLTIYLELPTSESIQSRTTTP
jgi:hypothetical protein